VFDEVNDSPRRNALTDWAVRIVIAVAFVLFGTDKFNSAPGSEWVTIFRQIGLGEWFRYFTGIVEVLGGVLILIPWTVTMGLALLACTMLGAMVTLAFVLHSPLSAVFPGMFLAGLIAVYSARRASTGLTDAARRAGK